MSGRRLLVTIVVGMLGISGMACSGTVSGTDLTSGDGGTSSGNAGNGGKGGGLLGGAVGNGGTSNNGGSTSSSSSSSGTATSTQGTQPSNGGGVCGTGESTNIAACDSCLNQSCCASLSACDKNPECVAFWNCAKVCNSGDEECGATCREQHPDGIADAKAFVTCVQGCGACQ